MEDDSLPQQQQSQQGAEEDENDFDEIVGYEGIRVNVALPTLVEWLAARGVTPEEQAEMRKVAGGTFLPNTSWEREGFASYLPVGESSEPEDFSGVEQKPKPAVRVENWYRLHERLLREHFWEMKHNPKAGNWDRDVKMSQMIEEARDNHLNASSLPIRWLDADRRYLNVLPEQVRREGWLRNPPRKGATGSDAEQWPKGGTHQVRRLHAGVPMQTVFASREGVSSFAWWKPIFNIPRPLGGPQSTGEALLCLDVEVLSLHFRDHQHYTEEDRVARLLSELYKTYTMKVAEGKIDRLQRQVDAIKSALGEAAPDGETAKTYRKELREVRELMDQEHSEQKQRERQLREVWNKLKYLRRLQGFNGAAIKMKWRNKKVDQEAEKQAFEQEIDERLQELRAEYDMKVIEFSSRIEKLDAIKLEKMEKRTLAAASHDPAKEERYASAIKKLDSRLKHLRKSTPEVKGFDEQAKRAELMEKYKAARTRMPGEPHLIPVILQDPIDDLKDTNAAEKERRLRVKATSFYVKLELNDTMLKHRSPSLPMPSSAESSIDFAHRFRIMVSEPPESLHVHLFEASKAAVTESKTLISKVPLQVPGATSLLPQRISQHSNVAFSGGEPFETHVTRMDANNKATRHSAIHYVDGDISVRVTWDTTAAKSLVNDKARAGQSALASLLPTGGTVDPNNPTSSASLPTMSNAPFDPNNPLDLPVIGGTREVVMEEGTSLDDTTDRNTYFRLDKDDSDINFIASNPQEERRNKLLQLRYSGKSDPALLEMPFKAEDVSLDMMEGATDEDILDFRKAKKKKTLTAGELKKIELKKRAGAAMPSERTREVRTEEIVHEEELPEFKFSLDWLFALLAPRNPLRPQLMERKAQRGVTEATIIIQVVAASNIPCRDVEGSEKGNDQDEEGECLPFIEVQFGRHEKATPMLQGTNVQWNYVIELPYASASGDLNAEKGEVEFNLFDREVTRDRSSGSGISETHQKRWLASFNLPFQTIFRAKSVNATVPMRLPLMNMGYRLPQPAQAVNLSFYATLEPNILPPEEEEDERPSSEDDVLRQYATKWLEDVQNRPDCADRNLCVLAPSSSGESVFATRYVHPQKPPPTCDNEASIARFVSLVPFANDEDDEGQRDDIWFTSHEFLQMQQGDWEEHAILLCNFLLSKGKEAYVILGTSMPDGDSAFVLTKEQDRNKQVWYCWDPTTGTKFPHTQPDCPLKDIGMVFNAENVWANVQPKSQNICFNSFDFEDPKCWRAFFGPGRLQMDTLTTCQKDDRGNTEISYFNPNMKTIWDETKESADERKKFTMVRVVLTLPPPPPLRAVLLSLLLPGLA